MGNTISSKSSATAVNASANAGGGKVNIDDIDLASLDESKSNLKENKKTRKSKEYKSLRTLARSGIDNKRRFELWRKATNGKEEYIKMYKDISNDLFSDIDMEQFPSFPLFGSGCTFQRLLPKKIHHDNENIDNNKTTLNVNNDNNNLIHSSQRILLVLAVEHDSLKYCPQLCYIVEEMLLDENATEYGVFSICHSMLVASKRNNWYFRTDYFNSYVRIKTFLSIFEDNVSLVASHLKSKNMDISNIMGDAISSMFVEYLNDETYLRLVDTFTVEGYKVLFRVGVALLNHAQSQLILCKDLKLFKNILIAESKKLEPDELCQRCFKIYLTRNKFDKLDKFHRDKGFDDKELNRIEDEAYVRRWPTWDKDIMDKSQILTKKVQFIQLWVWLPPGCHIGDYQLLFSTQDDGYKLSELYYKCQDSMNLIIIIKTTKKEIIGCFVSQLDDPEEPDGYPPLKKRIKDPKILLFQLYSNLNQNKDKFEPKCFWANTADQFYHQSNFQLKNMHTMRDFDMNELDINNDNDDEEKKDNDDNEDNEDTNYLQFATAHRDGQDQRIPIVFPSKESLIIGDGEDNCIFIDNDLNYGFSSKCLTFKSPSLVIEKDGQFQISQIEVWSVC